MTDESSAVPDFRVGIGHDTHRLKPGSPLRLGGIDIPHDRELIGHSDADALLHAVTDSILGAAALGDIGEMFPDTDPDNEGRDSAGMLRAACDRVEAAGWQVVNLDCVVRAERPKLTPHREAICQRIGEVVGIGADRVSVKAKSGEGVGSIGREETMICLCVAMLARRK